jgi:hypothetical protein
MSRPKAYQSLAPHGDRCSVKLDRVRRDELSLTCSYFVAGVQIGPFILTHWPERMRGKLHGGEAPTSSQP